MERLNRLNVTTALFAVLLILSLTGCTGMFAQLFYLVKGHKIPAEFDDLKNCRVAVVCVSDASSYGPDTLSNSISRALEIRLRQHYKTKIELIPQSEIEVYKDTHYWDEMDFVSLGQGINADKVIAIEIASYSIYDGQTLYKGRALVETNVYDIEKQGEIVFTQQQSEFQFPRSHGRPIGNVSEQQFEAVFLTKLVDKISYNFVQHERDDTFADDATMFD